MVLLRGCRIHACYHSKSQTNTHRVHNLPTIANTRRHLLLGSTAIVSSTYVLPTICTPYTYALELDQVFAGPRFSFTYPATFVVAYDRERVEYGSLVAVADYNQYLTFVVEREPAPDGAADALLAGDAATLLRNKVQVPSTMDFVVNSTRVRLQGTRRFLDVDYSLETCQGGEVQEGLRGVLRCLDPNSGASVRTARRRNLATLTLVDNPNVSTTPRSSSARSSSSRSNMNIPESNMNSPGSSPVVAQDLYIAVASASEASFASVQEQFEAMLMSFTV